MWLCGAACGGPAGAAQVALCSQRAGSTRRAFHTSEGIVDEGVIDRADHLRGPSGASCLIGGIRRGQRQGRPAASAGLNDCATPPLVHAFSCTTTDLPAARAAGRPAAKAITPPGATGTSVQLCRGRPPGARALAAGSVCSTAVAFRRAWQLQVDVEIGEVHVDVALGPAEPWRPCHQAPPAESRVQREPAGGVCAIGTTKVTPVEVVTNRAPTYPVVLEELLPAAWRRTERHANNRVEADHGRLKARLRPMRGLKQVAI